MSVGVGHHKLVDLGVVRLTGPSGIKADQAHAATPLISDQASNARVLAARCSLAVTWSRKIKEVVDPVVGGEEALRLAR
jgi:hypothetical protein